MIKSLVVTLFLLITGLYAQSQILYSVKVSGGIATQQVASIGLISTKIINTFNFSGVVELPVKYGFWLESGLGIKNKGSELEDNALTITTRLTYLQLPFDVVRKFTFTDIGIFYLGAGGYVANGLWGSFDYQTPSSVSSDNVRFGNDNDFRRIDAGLNFITGFELKNKLTFNIEYSLGLNNIASQTQKDTGTLNIKNRLFSLGLGYLF